MTSNSIFDCCKLFQNTDHSESTNTNNQSPRKLYKQQISANKNSIKNFSFNQIKSPKSSLKTLSLLGSSRKTNLDHRNLNIEKGQGDHGMQVLSYRNSGVPLESLTHSKQLDYLSRSETGDRNTNNIMCITTYQNPIAYSHFNVNTNANVNHDNFNINNIKNLKITNKQQPRKQMYLNVPVFERQKEKPLYFNQNQYAFLHKSKQPNPTRSRCQQKVNFSYNINNNTNFSNNINNNANIKYIPNIQVNNPYLKPLSPLTPTTIRKTPCSSRIKTQMPSPRSNLQRNPQNQKIQNLQTNVSDFNQKQQQKKQQIIQEKKYVEPVGSSQPQKIVQPQKISNIVNKHVLENRRTFPLAHFVSPTNYQLGGSKFTIVSQQQIQQIVDEKHMKMQQSAIVVNVFNPTNSQMNTWDIKQKKSSVFKAISK